MGGTGQGQGGEGCLGNRWRLHPREFETLWLCATGSSNCKSLRHWFGKKPCNVGCYRTTHCDAVHSCTVAWHQLPLDRRTSTAEPTGYNAVIPETGVGAAVNDAEYPGDVTRRYPRVSWCAREPIACCSLFARTTSECCVRKYSASCDGTESHA